MPGTRRTQSKKQDAKDRSTRPSRSLYEVKYVGGLDGDLEKIGGIHRIKIVTRIEAFEAEWKANVPDNELYSTFDYKKLQGSKSNELKVMQIRQGDYRVALIIHDESTSIWLLDVYDRKDYLKAIDRAFARARKIRGES